MNENKIILELGDFTLGRLTTQIHDTNIVETAFKRGANHIRCYLEARKYDKKPYRIEFRITLSEMWAIKGETPVQRWLEVHR